ncbi:hypothetical protein FB567DRAFT_206966 [Paraphoma chrysanthemicola]|uniref:Heterokaryon incompatibility domain-containing protein n=1 Tax=Paraphoma chrysanthemicola TaxID=798071 RepID=A0A8K0VSR5_9PLEO|nr:hypothetical protein FB567DRAFT_206966 [Paraphoma chrysanthemicola]
MSITACRSLLRSWLAECDKSHKTCTTPAKSFLPTRLLDLGEVDTQNRIRIVLSRHLSPDTRYVSLSHCWGANVPFQLTTSTIDMMKAGFDLDELPKTFRNAVTVARWADVRYIWIDSCCILQRSDADKNNEWKSDWEWEAGMMQHVYKNTYFNISADHSENSHGGLFLPRLAYKFSPCAFNIPSIGQIHILP